MSPIGFRSVPFKRVFIRRLLCSPERRDTWGLDQQYISPPPPSEHFDTGKGQLIYGSESEPFTNLQLILISTPHS